MLNPRADIIKSFGAALSGLSYDGNTIPVYASTPQKAPDSLYIFIGTVTTNETGCKDVFGHDGSIDIQIIDNSKRNYATPEDIEEVTTLVLDTIKSTTTSVVSMTNHEMIWLTLANTLNDVTLFDTSYAPRNILTFNFEITETLADPCANWIMANDYWNDSGYWLTNCTWPA